MPKTGLSPLPSLSSRRTRRAGLREDLLEKIVAGRIAPGTPLSPVELASSLGVSATPLREALIELACDGFLSNEVNRGFIVRPLTVQEARDLYPIIWTLETLAVRSTPPETALLAELARTNARIRQATDPVEWVSLDAEWHELLVSECNNAVLISTLASLRARIRRYELAYARYSGSTPQSAKQHALIIQHFRAGKTRDAVCELEDNWRKGLRFLVPWLERIAPAPLFANNPPARTARMKQ